MPCPRIATGALLGVLGAVCLPAAGMAAGEVAGPVEIGPSWGAGDAAHSSATLRTILVNHGDLADRVVRAACPASGQVALTNGTAHQDVMQHGDGPAPATAEPAGGQNGLDLPAAPDGKVQPVTAIFTLTQARQPLADGVHVPCVLYLARDGERTVIFTLGPQPPVTAEP